MTELIALLKETGIPYVYSHWAQGEVPDTPYICYMMASTHPFSADGMVYKDFLDVELELYTDQPDEESKRKIASVLNSHGVFYEVEEIWISEEALYQTVFTFEMEVK